MVLDISWRRTMLNNLYRKLYILFTVTIMLIITFVILFAITNSVNAERTNERTMFQRMTTLLIYQLENTQSNTETIIEPYESKYKIFVLLSNANGKMVYKSNLSFSTQSNSLIQNVLEQTNQQQILPENDDIFTSQGGIFEISGTEHDNYFAIPATIATTDRNVYQGIFIYQVSDLRSILESLIPYYLLAWILAFIGVLVLTRLVLKRAFMPTERILKSQKDFVATASHELKSPLAVMIANTDTLIDNPSLDDISKQSVKTIESECMRLSKLVKDMLLLASSDAETWTLHQSEVDIDTLLITLYETYEQTCLKNNIELKLDLSEDTYPKLYTDKDRLFQILCIFMDNAIQHSKNNSLIEIKENHTAKQISFSIKDYGEGISDEDKQYIFDRFYSGDKSHNNKANFGLGLSIVEELTKMLNGNIEVSDTDGGGATFTVIFPLK